MIYATYILTLRGPDEGGPEKMRINTQYLRELQENLTDLMPMGYWVTVEAFDDLLDNEEEKVNG